MVAKGPANHQGHAIELYEPPSGSLAVSLPAGGSISLPPFRFRRARGRVVGYVLEENTQRGRENVGLLLTPVGEGATLHATTGDGGEFAFHEVPAGVYELSLDDFKITASDGSEWVLSHGTPKTLTVTVQPGKTNYLPPLFLTLDEHLLTISVLDPEDHPVGNVEVDVRDEQGNFIGTFPVDASGKVTVRVSRAGTYSVSLGVHTTGIPRQAAQQVYVNQPADAIIRLLKGACQGLLGDGGTTAPREAVVDIPYPLLTEGSVTVQGGWPSSSSAPSSSDLGQTVQSALREVLNWRPSGYQGDAKGFVAALNQSFALRQIEGHTEFTWTPRSYAAVQTGLGALTGAQASIFTRAQVARDQALPLLDGLYPLRSDADDQDVAAIRAIVRSGWTELVNELGIEGGPRVLRVDDLFRQLTGSLGSVINPDPEQVGGQLGQLASLFGLSRSRVNTIDEEQNLTNFLIVADYTLGLLQSWLTQRRFFTRGSGSEPFLGTQLVLVERSLAVVAESVQEVYRAMDSVFLGREERQVVELRSSKESPAGPPCSSPSCSRGSSRSPPGKGRSSSRMAASRESSRSSRPSTNSHSSRPEPWSRPRNRRSCRRATARPACSAPSRSSPTTWKRPPTSSSRSGSGRREELRTISSQRGDLRWRPKTKPRAFMTASPPCAKRSPAGCRPAW